MKSIHEMTVAEFAEESEHNKLMQSHIWTKAYRLEAEKILLLEALEDLIHDYAYCMPLEKAKAAIANARGSA